MSPKLNELDIVVRFAETDAMSVAHHSNYYVWFEMGRFVLTKNILSAGYREVTGQKLLAPVLRSHCRHYSFAAFDDKLRLIVKMKPSDSVKLIFYYELRHLKTGKLVAIGKTEHTLIDENRNLILMWPKNLLDELKKAQENHPECFTKGDEYDKKL